VKRITVMFFLVGLLMVTSCGTALVYTVNFAGMEGVFNVLEADGPGYDYRVYVTNRHVLGGLDMSKPEVRRDVVAGYLAEVCGPIEVEDETFLPLTSNWGQYVMKVKCLGKGGGDYESKRNMRKTQ
jgi:hypothetical protein